MFKDFLCVGVALGCALAVRGQTAASAANADAPKPAADAVWTAPAPPLAEKLQEDAKQAAEKKDDKKEEKKDDEKKKAWYEKLNIRGYTQLRYNEAVGHDRNGADPQLVGDASVGDDRNFLIRRARLILFGDVHERLYLYFQPDFAVTAVSGSDAIQFAQLRDLYADIYLDDDKEWRIRAGQSKIPYGFENLQSSQNRLPLDRNDAMNSVVRNERELGVFFYYTPKPVQDFFKRAVDDGLKGSGNYGVFGIGVYNGQGGSFLEQNEGLHAVARLTLPFVCENGQAYEFSVQGLCGRYTVASSSIRARGAGDSIRPVNTLENSGRAGIREERLAVSGVLYPQPFGLQAEWNVGRGPALNDAQNEVVRRGLHGGYIQAFYKHDSCAHGTFIPFLRYNYFQGGYRFERNAPYAKIDEWELGLEWQISKALELTTAMTLTDRTNTTAIDRAGVVPYEQFRGGLLRAQLQWNY